MYIIPQNLKNVAKNLLINEISNITKEYATDIVESIFDDSNLDKYQNIVSKGSCKNKSYHF